MISIWITESEPLILFPIITPTVSSILWRLEVVMNPILRILLRKRTPKKVRIWYFHQNWVRLKSNLILKSMFVLKAWLRPREMFTFQFKEEMIFLYLDFKGLLLSLGLTNVSHSYLSKVCLIWAIILMNGINAWLEALNARHYVISFNIKGLLQVIDRMSLPLLSYVLLIHSPHNFYNRFINYMEFLKTQFNTRAFGGTKSEVILELMWYLLGTVFTAFLGYNSSYGL